MTNKNFDKKKKWKSNQKSVCICRKDTIYVHVLTPNNWADQKYRGSTKPKCCFILLSFEYNLFPETRGIWMSSNRQQASTVILKCVYCSFFYIVLFLSFTGEDSVSVILS